MFGNLPALDVYGLSLGLRELVLALVAIVVIYIAVVLIRMQRLRRAALAKETEPEPESAAEPPAAEDEPAAVAPGVDEFPEPRPAAASERLSEPLPGNALARELGMLRDEVDAMRGELAALRNDMQQELAHLRASQSVSPIYGDAMQMAAAGYDATTIAERCGIARGEAELVVALARSQAQ